MKKKLYLTPLSDIGEKDRVDPINDLRPVCPNCPVIIHTKYPPYSIDEVVAMIRNTTTAMCSKIEVSFTSSFVRTYLAI